MTQKLNYLEIEPPKKINKLIIFIHGYGANGKDLLHLTPFFQKEIKDLHSIAPNAPYETGMMEESYFWFPIGSFEPDHLQDGLNQALPILDKFINVIIDKYNVSSEQIILCGFSQGSLLSIHYALTQKHKFHSVISFSGGALPDIAEKITNQTPVILVHGLNDQVLSAEYSLNSAEIFEQIGHPYDIKIIPNLEHSINKEGIDFALEKLLSRN